jgi:hypothetical protein
LLVLSLRLQEVRLASQDTHDGVSMAARTTAIIPLGASTDEKKTGTGVARGVAVTSRSRDEARHAWSGSTHAVESSGDQSPSSRVEW